MMETIAVIDEHQLDSEASLLSTTPLQGVDGVETSTPSPVEMDVVDKTTVEAVNAMMGRVVEFVVGPVDYNLTSELLVDKLLAMPFGAQGQSRFTVPTNLKMDFRNATHGLFRSQYSPPEIERPGRVAFRVNGEYFMRPPLSRSLSLP